MFPSGFVSFSDLLPKVQPQTKHRGCSLPDLLSCSWDKLRKLFSLRRMPSQWELLGSATDHMLVSLQIQVLKP